MDKRQLETAFASLAMAIQLEHAAKTHGISTLQQVTEANERIKRMGFGPDPFLTLAIRALEDLRRGH